MASQWDAYPATALHGDRHQQRFRAVQEGDKQTWIHRDISSQVAWSGLGCSNFTPRYLVQDHQSLSIHLECAARPFNAQVRVYPRSFQLAQLEVDKRDWRGHPPTPASICLIAPVSMLLRVFCSLPFPKSLAQMPSKSRRSRHSPRLHSHCCPV